MNSLKQEAKKGLRGGRRSDAFPRDQTASHDAGRGVNRSAVAGASQVDGFSRTAGEREHETIKDAVEDSVCDDRGNTSVNRGNRVCVERHI